MPKFNPKDRVIFQDRENPGFPTWFHAASWGDNDKVMHLNARDEAGRIKPITGTILRVVHTDDEGNVTYGFQPDGWPEENHGFTGCQLDEKYFAPLLDDRILPGTITDRMGNKI